MKSECKITSEYGQLEVAMVYEPGNEIERLTPSNKKELLFDDVPYLEEMKREHAEFVEELIENEVNVLQMKELLTEVLKKDDIKESLISECVELDRCNGMKNEQYLNDIDLENLVEILFAGMTEEEWDRIKFEEKNSENIRSKPEDDEKKRENFFISPIPNSYFTRDPSAIIGNGVVSCKMFYPIRAREALIMKYIFKFHPLFRGDTPFWYGEKEEEYRPYTIEGGDIIVLNSDTVAVGNSERTKPYSIEKLAQNLFNHNVVDEVYEVRIPPERTYMHLDTVFSIINKDLIIYYPKALNEKFELIKYRPSVEHGELVARPSRVEKEFIDNLDDMIGTMVTKLETGGGDITEGAKEQFNDGTNTLAIAPGKVIAYTRNKVTNKVLEDNDVDVIRIDGNELVRGRGGPRCMILPLRRK